MPTFPAYDGPPLPRALDPFDPRHYWLLATWIALRPSHLTQYLYRASPQLYFQDNPAWSDTLRRPAYRNLLLMALLLAAALSALLSWASSTLQGTSVAWGWWGLGLAVGTVGGLSYGVAGATALALTAGLALGAAVGPLTGIAVGLVGGPALGVTLGAALGPLVGVPFGLLVGLFSDWLWGLALVVGATRLVLYLPQLVVALWSMASQGPASQRLAAHPALHDEMVALPFPGLDHLLAAALAEDWSIGLAAARRLLRNPWQRWSVARAMNRFFAASPDPLAALQRALSDPLLDECPLEPRSRQELREGPAVRALWLGELAGEYVEPGGRRWIYRQWAERLVWQITRSWRGQPHPEIGPLARRLLQGDGGT